MNFLDFEVPLLIRNSGQGQRPDLSKIFLEFFPRCIDCVI